MAALHLAFDVDADVYPELYAALACIGSEASRGERLRQLAATGLVWEAVRTRGAAALRGDAVADSSVLERAPSPVAPADPLTRAAPVRPTLAPQGGAPFIDLALDAPPEAPPSPRTSAPDHDALLRALPVLLDVVHAPLRSVPDLQAPEADAQDQPGDRPGTLAAVATLVHTSVPRSRLLRMKEKGLFKNG